MRLSRFLPCNAQRPLSDGRRSQVCCQERRRLGDPTASRPQLWRVAKSSQIRAETNPSQSSSSQVPGGYQDSLSRNTQLGRAVDDACRELDTLGNLEKESLAKANDLLKKLGYKGDITAPEIPPKVRPEDAQS